MPGAPTEVRKEVHDGVREVAVGEATRCEVLVNLNLNYPAVDERLSRERSTSCGPPLHFTRGSCY